MPAFLIPMAVAAAAGLAQGGLNAGSIGKQKKDNKERLGELDSTIERGGDGLSTAQKQVMETRGSDAVRGAATNVRQRSEQLQASRPMGGSDLAALRQEQARTIGRGAQDNALRQAELDDATRRASLSQARNEREQRRALLAAQTRDQINAIINPIQQAAGATGQFMALNQMAPGLGRGDSPVDDGSGLTGEGNPIIAPPDPGAIPGVENMTAAEIESYLERARLMAELGIV